MKKISAALLALILVMSASITVFGATKNDVDKKINSSFAYLSEEAWENGCTVQNNLKDFYVMTCAGADISKYKNDFLNSVSAALEAGEITTLDTAVLTTGAMLNMGIDVTNFNGFDLTKLLKEIPAEACANPYTFSYGISVAKMLSDDALAAVYAEKLAGYYEMGKGTDFWGGYGTSPDDLGIFIVGLSYTGNEYADLIDDAFKLLETYYTAQGYSNYGANADSTALALAAYSAAGNKAKADSIYDMLIANFYDIETGGFKAEYDPYYATADAVYGMALYKPLADDNKKAEPEKETTKPSANNKKDTVNHNKNSAENKSKKSPATGTGIGAAALAFAISTGTIAVLKKKEN